MMPLLLCLALSQAGDPKLDLENTRVFHYDAAKGYTFRILNDGKVELIVKEEDKESGKKTSKTFAAGSAEEFRNRYPDQVQRYGLGRLLGAPARPLGQDSFDEWWEKLKKGMPDLGPIPGLDQPFDEDQLQKLLEGQRGLFRLRPQRPDAVPRETPPRQVPIPGGREFGIKVEAVGETLREQLSLKESEGVLVTEVKPGSIAEKAGLKLHDLLLKLDGKAVTDRWQFRADALSALGKPEFGVELLRAGKRETVRVTTSVKKDE